LSLFLDEDKTAGSIQSYCNVKRYECGINTLSVIDQSGGKDQQGFGTTPITIF
jgi:hypothetical protein